MDDALLSPQEAADYLNLTTRFLEGRRRSGNSPPWIALSQKCVRYRPSDLIEWVESHTHNPAQAVGGV